MWAAQFFWGDNPYSFVTSGGLGTMGFEVPAAIGVQFARPRDTVWSFCGDGGFQMTMQDLALCTEYELPIKYAIINNNYLGMVRQWQDEFYNHNLSAVRMFQPDFVKIAEAMGISAMRVTDKTQVESAIETALRHPGAVVIDFQVDEVENCYPMMPPGVSLSDTIDQPPVKQPERTKEYAR
jgi:acetolactate synthase-1/2/3 large subunit